MTEIFRNRDSALVGHLQNILESEGIRTYFRNEYVSHTAVPLPEHSPVLCVLDDAEASRGIEMIRQYLDTSGARASEERICSNCGDTSPGTFETCWKCGGAL